MTRVDERCYRDAYQRELPARVLEVSATDGAPLVVLDATTFYPGGGGQPSDRGVILRTADGRRWTVRAARRVGGEIVHELEAPEDGELPAAGEAVTVDLDWARRYALMRTHTALHALCGVVWRDYGALVTGGNMEPGRGPHGLRVRADVAATSSARSRRRSTPSSRRKRDVRVERPAARRGVRDPGPDPDEDQPAAAGDRGDPDDRDRRPRPPGRRRDPRREHRARSAGSA